MQPGVLDVRIKTVIGEKPLTTKPRPDHPSPGRPCPVTNFLIYTDVLLSIDFRPTLTWVQIPTCLNDINIPTPVQVKITCVISKIKTNFPFFLTFEVRFPKLPRDYIQISGLVFYMWLTRIIGNLGIVQALDRSQDFVSEAKWVNR